VIIEWGGIGEEVGFIKKRNGKNRKIFKENEIM